MAGYDRQPKGLLRESGSLVAGTITDPTTHWSKSTPTGSLTSTTLRTATHRQTGELAPVEKATAAPGEKRATKKTPG
jgi:hypothetical protein